MKMLIVYLLCMPLSLFAQKRINVRPAVSDRLQTAGSAHLQGFVADRMQAAYQHRILAQDVDRLVAPFRSHTETRCWQSEFWGKWFTSAVLAYRYHPTPALKAALDKAVDKLLATQTPDGYIGNYAPGSHLQQWDVWGRKYCMLGLLAYYDLSGSTRSLQAARRLADHLMQELAGRKALLVKLGNHRGMAATSVLEPVCLLYARTGDKRYLQFATEIVREWESADGPQLIAKAGVDVAKRFPRPASWFGWEQGQKAYEMMSCYEGLLELYRLSGKSEYKDAVERTWENIRNTEINIAGSGSAMECWFGGRQLQTAPVSHYQETCVTVTWIKLSQQLLRLTGKSKYADAIEQTFYNALLGAMKPDGADWAKYSPLQGQRLEGSEQCGMGLNCCVASGPRGLFTLPLTAVMSEQDGLRVNFFIPGDYSLVTPRGRQVKVVQQTDYPATGKISLQLQLPEPETLALRIRIPAWSRQTTLQLNGQTAGSTNAGEYTEIRRQWKPGDIVTLELDMRGRVVYTGMQPTYAAIVRGPLVLARDARLPGPDVAETVTPLARQEGLIDLEPAEPQQAGAWLSFTAPFMLESHKEEPGKPVRLLLCDYASAGNTYDARSRFRVWLPQPIDPRK